MAAVPFIIGSTTGALRSDFTGDLGLQFTPVQGLKLTSLGRIWKTGNNQLHTVKLAYTATGGDVPGGSVVIDSSLGSGDDTYQYVALAAPIYLLPGVSYYLSSSEVALGDVWRDSEFTTNTGDASVDWSVFSVVPGAWTNSTQFNTFIPVNFLYETGTPVGQWPLDDLSGTTAVDHSGNGNDGALINGAAFVAGPPAACSFNGSDQDILAPSVGCDIDVDMTLAMWIKRSALAKRGGLIAKTDGSMWNFDLLISNSITGDEITFYADSITPTTVDSFASAVSDLAWHHVAVTFVKSGGTLVFYIDGAVTDTHTGLGGGPGSSPGETIHIASEGYPPAGSINYFQGQQHDVRVYSRALSAGEVAALAVPPSTGFARSIGLVIG